jgi:hypothetical protein
MINTKTPSRSPFTENQKSQAFKRLQSFQTSLKTELEWNKNVENIGSLDKLGNFMLDSRLKAALETEKLSYWTKMKTDFMQQSEKDVRIEAYKIISEVLSELVKHSSIDNYPECIKSFLSESNNSV